MSRGRPINNRSRDIKITRSVINNQPVTDKLSKTRIREVTRNTLRLCTHPKFTNGINSKNNHHDHLKVIRKNKSYWLGLLDKVEEYSNDFH